MNKTSAIVLSPLLTKSGYGHRAFDFCKALIKIRPDWDIVFLSQKWGGTPFYETNDAEITSRLREPHELQGRQFDVSINITVPNEFKPYAKFNIGVSAGVETTLMPPECIEGMNRIDVTLMSSNHSKNISESSKFDRMDDKHNKVGVTELLKPVGTLFEGVDINIFNRKNTQEFNLDVKEKFCFIMSGVWLPGDFTNPYGHDRKQIGTTIKIFLETFKDNADVALVLKTNGGGYSFSDREEILKKIDAIRNTCGENLPNIYLIHGDLSTNQLIGLYQNEKIKGLISVGNEGWNRIPLEFSCTTSKPMIMSPFSGHTDYLKSEFNLMVGGSLQPIHKSVQNQYLIPGSKIFYPDVKQLSGAMLSLYNDYSKYEELGKRQGHWSRTNFSLEKMEQKLDEILTGVVPKFSRPKPIQLPKLVRKDLAEPK